MSWAGSFFIAFLTAVIGGVAAGFVASLAVEWHNVPSRDLQAAFLVIVLFLTGALGGFIVGLIVSRLVAARPGATFFRAFWISQVSVLAVIGSIGLISRLLADVPPEIGGQQLLLGVEIRLPAVAPRPDGPNEEAHLLLGSLTRSRVVRASTKGPLWMEDARHEGGRWIVPGAVEIFTSRGNRLLVVSTGAGEDEGFVIPLRGYPGKAELQWSDWLPRAEPGGTASRHEYRFRVVPRDQPIRTETYGPFEIDTIAESFYEEIRDQKRVHAATAETAIRHRGELVSISTNEGTIERFSAVAALSAKKNMLLVDHGADPGSRECHLLISRGEQVEVRPLPGCSGVESAALLTSDSVQFADARASKAPRGRFDRTSLARDGIVHLGGLILDTRRLSTSLLQTTDEKSYPIEDVPPLLLSPDERSYVRAGYSRGETDTIVLAVTHIPTGDSYTVPIDFKRTRFTGPEMLDAAWVSHYFEWIRDEGGIDRLVTRENAVPLPYRGRLTVAYDGYREYLINRAGQPLFDAFVAFLEQEFGARQIPRQRPYTFNVSVDGKILHLYGPEDGRITVFMDRTEDSELVATVASRFDEALATGRFDALFE